MQIEIFDVDHGQCALATSSYGAHMLIDCGHNGLTGWRPSAMLAARRIGTIATLVISNCDEDHISDLSAVVGHLQSLGGNINIGHLGHNQTLTPDVIQQAKAPFPLSADMRVLCGLIQRYNAVPGVGGLSINAFGPGVCSHFRNQYPQDFSNPAVGGFCNNLSFTTFLHFGDIHILFPGDLEAAGWQRLLQAQTFLNELATVNVLVASHHGRQSGFYAPLFQIGWRPKVIIVSDGAVQYDTQTGVYGANHSDGILMSPYQGSLINATTRHVLTTRRDTSAMSPAIVIEQTPGALATVRTATHYGFLL